jgi:pyruvate ferredoxin oxidoreductase beta subunit
MAKRLATFKSHAIHEDGFGPGHSLCPGCMEAITFHEVGRASDNGRKTVVVLATSCGEVSTLAVPGLVAWGRGEAEPDALEKSMGVIHHVFESAPTVAEAVRDTADVLADLGAWQGPPPNVVAVAGDGGALVIGLRSLLHAIHRRARVTIVVNVNEVFANTGFQYSPTALPFAASSTRPRGSPAAPLDYIGLAITAGAGYVAQASAAYPPFFAEVFEEALACEETAVVFVPTPCISGWKFEEGLTAGLARLGAETGLYPCFRKHRGRAGEIKHLPPRERRPKVVEFLALQERFGHLVSKKNGSGIEIAAGREAQVEALQALADDNAERLARWARWDC